MFGPRAVRRVLRQAVSFSRYFHAGVGSADAWRPFGHSQKILDQYSPTLVAARLPADLLMGLYIVLDFDPAQSLYGPEGESFVTALKQSGYAYAVISAGQKHSWSEVRHGLGPALALVGSRQVTEGIFA